MAFARGIGTASIFSERELIIRIINREHNPAIQSIMNIKKKLFASKILVKQMQPKRKYGSSVRLIEVLKKGNIKAFF